MLTPIGYLIPLKQGWGIRCIYCEVERQGAAWMTKDGQTVKMFHENVYPYRQTCMTCHRVLVEGRKGWPELFTGKHHAKV